MTCIFVYYDDYMSEEPKKGNWVKRTTIDEPRLSEVIREYESLGFEVHIEPAKPEELDEDCKKCYGNKIDKLKTVYVRKRKAC
jgi:signal recognition particle subunit SEC65